MTSETVRSSSQSLMQEMNVNEVEITRRKQFLEFEDADVERLQQLNAPAQKYADEIIDDLYRHFLSHDETRAFFRDPKVLAHVKNAQKQYFLRLTEGNYDTGYIEGRLTIGSVHERIGLEPKWYLGAYNFYLRTVANRIMTVYGNDPGRALSTFLSLMKLVFLDIGLAFDTYIFQRQRVITRQQQAIRELSTPVLQVREQLLILPIVGAIDTGRARQITESLLQAIRNSRAKVVVIDITGVPAVDSAVANHLVQTVDASRLVGATVIVTGLSAEIAQTLVTIGVDLTRMNTVGDLQGGIEQAERILGYRVTRDLTQSQARQS